MSACVLGLVVWKALDAKKAALEQSERDIRNLAHSLAEHASHSIQAADVAMSGMVDLLKYQRPRAEPFNLFMRNTARSLPQLREIGVLDTEGNWIYSSLAETPRYSNSDRDYFAYHRDAPDPSIRINAPLNSRAAGRPTIVLSKRIDKLDGSFGGVLVAGIDADFFNDFYQTFKLGAGAGITLLRNDGTVLSHWPPGTWSSDVTLSSAFKAAIAQDATGYYRIKSPFDGYLKYFGFERASQYPLVVSVAVPVDQLLARWRDDLRKDAAVAAVLLCSVVLLAALLSAQFRSRLRTENALRDVKRAIACSRTTSPTS